MFVTIDSMRMHIPLPPGVHQWKAAEVELLIPLLMVSMTQKETEVELPIARTFLILPEDLEALLGSDEFTLDQIYLLSPSRTNGSDRWQLEPLQELWKCSEPGSKDVPAWLFRVPGHA